MSFDSSSTLHPSSILARGWNLPLYNMNEIACKIAMNIHVGKKTHAKSWALSSDSISDSRNPIVASNWLCLSLIVTSVIIKYFCVIIVWIYHRYRTDNLQRIINGNSKIILKTKFTAIESKTSSCPEFFLLAWSKQVPFASCQFS